MRGRWMVAAVALPTLVAVLALYLAVDNIARAGPGSGSAALLSMPTVISYQGRLADPGTGQPKPDGNYNMRFRIYDAASGGTLLWAEPAAADPAASVSVAGGVFTRLLGSSVALNASVFSGGNAYLEVEVNGETLSPRQRIGAVAYAMVAGTLSVPASLSGDIGPSIALLDVTNNGGVGLWGHSTTDTGVAGWSNSGLGVDGLSNSAPGVLGRSQSGPGVRAESVSGPAISAMGDVEYSGALVGAFPRPAYDSGWLAITANTSVAKTHNLGGDAGDYVVDLQCRGSVTYGTTIRGYGGWQQDNGLLRGAFWSQLGSTSITISRLADDVECPQVRVRIWEIK